MIIKPHTKKYQVPLNVGTYGILYTAQLISQKTEISQTGLYKSTAWVQNYHTQGRNF
jgi:hypothetical protein